LASVTSQLTDPEWVDGIREALRGLAERALAPYVFVEEREDLRIELSTVTHPELVHTRLCGISIRTGSGPHQYRHHSDPVPADAVRLALGQEGDRYARRTPRTSWLDARPILASLDQALGSAVAEAAADGLDIRASYAASEQRVLIGRAGHPILADRRSGARVRFEVGLRRRGACSSAATESALRPEEPAVFGPHLMGALQRAAHRLDARPTRPGERPVVLAPGVGGVLVHEIVGHALEGDTVARGRSMLARLQPPVAPTTVRVIDDPRRGRAPWAVDDEGEPSRSIALVEQGRVAGYLLDLDFAREMGRKPTGHGRRASYRERVLPRMGCTFIAAGELDPRELIEDVASGIYVRRMEAASVDLASGWATFWVSDADEIVDGRLHHACEPFLLALEAQKVLPRIDRVASDLTLDACIGNCLRDGQAIATSVGAPTIRLGLATVISWERQ
jgi:TldD protein